MIYKELYDLEGAICEGLIRTHNIESSVNFLDRWYSFSVKDFHIRILDNGTFEIKIKDHIRISLWEILVRDINNLGYFPSVVYLTNDNNMINKFKYDYDKINRILSSKKIIEIQIVCEKKFDDEIIIKDKIYHVCKENNLTKIMNIGLCPRSKKRLGDHPNRIYFCLSIENSHNLIKTFKNNDYMNGEEKNYSIIEINIPQINEDCKNKIGKILFRQDPNMMIDGVYTYDNIHEKYLKLI